MKNICYYGEVKYSNVEINVHHKLSAIRQVLFYREDFHVLTYRNPQTYIHVHIYNMTYNEMAA